MSCACNPNAPLPSLAGVTTWAASGQRLTPEMQHWAVSIAYDCTVPIGTVFKKWFGVVPVVARCECHPERWNADGTKTPGAFHAATLYYPTSKDMLPPAPTQQQVTQQQHREDVKDDKQAIAYAILVAAGTYAFWMLRSRK